MRGMFLMGIRVSLKQVAEAAGVSVSTASQALRGDGRIAAKTRELVEAAANTLGYQRDPILSQFAAKRFHTDERLVGSTLLFVTARTVVDSGGRIRYVAQFEKRACELGYRFEHCELADEFDIERLQRQWFTQGVRGIAFGDVFRCPWILDHPFPKFPVISIGGYAMHKRHHIVKNSVSGAVMTVYRRAQERGYQRIGFALLRHRLPLIDDRIRSGLAWDFGRDLVPPIPLYDGSMNSPVGFQDWLQKYQPDAVIAFPSLVHIWIREMGLRVPGDVALFGTDCTPGASITGWVENTPLIASRAAEQLDLMIRHGERGRPEAPSTISIAGGWNEGVTGPQRDSRRDQISATA